MTFTKKLRAAKVATSEMLNFKGKTVWNQVLKDSGMFQDDYMIQACDPVFINELIERYEALEKKLKEMADIKFAYLYKYRDEFGEERSTTVVGPFGPALSALQELGE